jgi:hypothetical protein
VCDEDAGALKPTLAMLNAKKTLKKGANLLQYPLMKN